MRFNRAQRGFWLFHILNHNLNHMKSNARKMIVSLLALALSTVAMAGFGGHGVDAAAKLGTTATTVGK